MREHGARADRRRAIVAAVLAPRPVVVIPAIWPGEVLFAEDADRARLIAERIYQQRAR